MPLRRVARWILGIAIGIVLLVATSAIVVETPWFKDRLRRIAVNRANEALNGQLTIGRLTGSLWKGVDLENVTLTQAVGPVLRVDRVHLAYDPLTLIRGHLVFDQLTLVRPVITIVQGPGGWNVAGLTKPSNPNGKPLSIQFQHVSIEDGQMRVKPASLEARQFADFNASLALSSSAAGLKVDVDRLSMRDADTGWSVQKGTVAYTSEDADLHAAIDLSTSAGSLDGKIAGAPAQDGRRLRGTFQLASLDLAPVLANDSLTSDITGTVQVEAALPSAARANPTISFQVNAPAVSALGYEAADVQGSGSYRDGVLHLDVAGAAYGARATARGEWRSASVADRPNTLALSGRLSGLDLRSLPDAISAPPLESRLAGEYQFTYRPASWAVSLRLDRSRLEGAEIADGTRVHAAMRDGVPSYELQGRLAHLDLQRLARPLDIVALRQDRFKSDITGDVHVTGHGRSIDAMALDADASLSDSTIGGAHLPSADVGAQLASGRLVVTFSGPFEHIDSQLVGVAGTPVDLSGRSDGLRVVFENLRGPIELGTIEADGRVTLGPSVVAGYDIDQATVDAALAGGTARIREFSAKGAELDATAQGVLALGGEAASDLSFTVDAQSVQAVAGRIGQPIAGGAHIEGTITGPTEDLSASGSIGLRQFRYGSSFDALAVNGTFGAEVANQQWSDVSAHVDTTATFVKIAGQDVQQMTAKATYHADRLDLDTTIEQKDRTFELSGLVLVQPEQDEVRLRRLAITTADQAWSLPEAQPAVVRYGGGRISVQDLTLAKGPEQVTVNGALTTGAGARAEGLTVKADAVQIGDVNQLFSGTRNLSGVLSGTVDVQGTVANPAIESHLTITDGAVDGTTFQNLTADAGYEDGRVNLDATLDVRPGAQLTATGYVPVSLGSGAGAAPRPIDLKVESTPIDLGIFGALSSEVNAVTGTGQFNCTCHGYAHRAAS